jgi:aspartyl/asparaginyl beta-hydroxylase (cupin superfamily)
MDKNVRSNARKWLLLPVQIVWGVFVLIAVLIHLFCLKLCEFFISLLASSRREFFSIDEFPWAAELEEHWREIREELDHLLPAADLIPNFQDLMVEQQSVTQDDRWKVFVFLGYGSVVPENWKRCPRTGELLKKIPGLTTAMFSILRGKKHIPEHRGPYKGVLRYHLALKVPEPAEFNKIRVGSETRTWEEGKSMIFDDTFPHEVMKETEGDRVVLFVDFIRPLPQPLDLMNRLVIYCLGALPFIRHTFARQKKWEEVLGPQFDSQLERADSSLEGNTGATL